MTSGLVKWDDRSRNSRGEDGILDQKRGKTPLTRRRSESRFGVETDAELRKHREQKGLETPVVHTVNDVH